MKQDILDILDHAGVKGMKWGVRKDASRADKKWAKNIYTLKSAINVHNNVADRMNSGEIAKFNAKHAKPNHNYLDNTSPETHRYHAEYEKLTAKVTADAVKEVHGTSPSGGYKARLDISDPSEWKIVVKPADDVEHAADPFPTLIMELVVENGIIVSTKSVKEQVLEQSMDPEEFLQHYGKKGMKWGVRQKRTQVKVSSDYKKTAPLRNRRTRELTNKQLKNVNERINMEQNYRRLNPTKVKIGSDMVKGTLAALTTAASIYTLANSPAGKAAIATGKSFLKKKL